MEYSNRAQSRSLLFERGFEERREEELNLLFNWACYSLPGQSVDIKDALTIHMGAQSELNPTRILIAGQSSDSTKFFQPHRYLLR